MRLPHQREISQTVYGRFHCTVDFPRVGSPRLRNMILYDLLKVMLSGRKIDQLTFRRRGTTPPFFRPAPPVCRQALRSVC